MATVMYSLVMFALFVTNYGLDSPLGICSPPCDEGERCMAQYGNECVRIDNINQNNDANDGQIDDPTDADLGDGTICNPYACRREGKCCCQNECVQCGNCVNPSGKGFISGKSEPERIYTNNQRDGLINDAKSGIEIFQEEEPKKNGGHYFKIIIEDPVQFYAIVIFIGVLLVSLTVISLYVTWKNCIASRGYHSFK